MNRNMNNAFSRKTRGQAASLWVQLWVMALVLGMVHLPLVGSLASIARAQEAVSTDRGVAVFVYPKRSKDETQAIVMRNVTRQAVEKLVGVTLVTGSPIQNEDAGKVANALAGEGDRLLNQDSNQNPAHATQALQKFEEAAGLLKDAPGAADARLWALIQKGMGVAKIMTEDVVVGEGNIRTSLILYPNQSSMEYGYTLQTQRSFDKVSRDLAASPNGGLVISSIPGGAEIYVDGEMHGFTDSPKTVGNLAPGLHRVELLLDGFWRNEAFVKVDGGPAGAYEVALQEAPLRGVLEGGLRGIQRKFSTKNPRKSVPFLQSVKEAVRADELLVLRVASTGSGDFLVEGLLMGSGDAVTPVTHRIRPDAGFFDAIRLFVETQFGTVTAPPAPQGPLSMPTAQMLFADQGDDSLVIDPDSPLFKDAGGADEDSLTSKWWFWTLIGVGVAGAAAAIVLPLTLGGDEESDKGPTGDLRIHLSGY